MKPPSPSLPSRGAEIRPATASDRPAIRSFVAGLSVRTQFLRFFAAVSSPSGSLLRSMCGAGARTDVLVAIEHGQVIGHAIAADHAGPDGGLATDVGLVVADGWQRQGVGTALMRALAGRAAARGASSLLMDVLPENLPVLAMIGRRWPGARYRFEPDAVIVCVSVGAPVRPGVGAPVGAGLGVRAPVSLGAPVSPRTASR